MNVTEAIQAEVRREVQRHMHSLCLLRSERRQLWLQETCRVAACAAGTVALVVAGIGLGTWVQDSVRAAMRT